MFYNNHSTINNDNDEFTLQLYDELEQSVLRDHRLRNSHGKGVTAGDDERKLSLFWRRDNRAQF